MTIKIETIESVAAAGNKATMAGAGMTGLGWFTSNEFFGVVGALVAIGGLLITWYYKREASKLRRADDARRQKEHELRISERQMRIDLMRSTGRPIYQPERDTDLGVLEVDE